MPRTYTSTNAPSATARTVPAIPRKAGNSRLKDLRSPDAQKLSEAEMLDIVAKGKGKDMDGFEKELGKDTIKNLVTYYRALAKK
jgi:hypothetical protein